MASPSPTTDAGGVHGYCVQLGAEQAGCDARACALNSGLLSFGACEVGLFCTRLELSPLCASSPDANDTRPVLPTVFVAQMIALPSSPGSLATLSASPRTTALSSAPTATYTSSTTQSAFVFGGGGIGGGGSGGIGGSQGPQSASNGSILVSPLALALSSVALVAIIAAVALAIVVDRRNQVAKTRIFPSNIRNDPSHGQPHLTVLDMPPSLRSLPEFDLDYKPAFYYKDDFFDTDCSFTRTTTTTSNTSTPIRISRPMRAVPTHLAYASHATRLHGTAELKDNHDDLHPDVDARARAIRRRIRAQNRQEKERKYLMDMMARQPTSMDTDLHERVEPVLMHEFDQLEPFDPVLAGLRVPYLEDIGLPSSNLAPPPLPPIHLLPSPSQLLEMEERNRLEIEQLHRVIMAHGPLAVPEGYQREWEEYQATGGSTLRLV
ncbi:hypothetical protein BC830DRAFT_1107677 [Chytriomyces sp. MP71]|nr:hypothetical protein BC830DRAFT_1107677 [Chytriomyces sp. MP71]